MSRATCIGSVRGCCGHAHRSIEAAEACIARDQRGCESQGGYSDRRVVTAEDYTYSERCAAGSEIMDRISNGSPARG